MNHVDVVFLDIFLSKDRIYGLDIMESLTSDFLVCFSSKKEMSDAMADSTVEKKHPLPVSGGMYHDPLS